MIIGAGPGGYETAVEAAKAGLEVTIISDGPVGGTCLNEGCIPTKTLCHSAELIEAAKSAAQYGVQVNFEGLDLSKALSRKDEVVGQLRSGVEFLLKGKGISLVYGKASFKDAHTVVVDSQEIEADYVIIATGSSSACLPIPGKEYTVTSTQMLSPESVPQRLCIIGAGVIGLEFASIYNSFGSEVTVLEFCKEILPRFDVDLAKRLKQSLSKKGISIETSACVQSVSKTGSGYEVTYLKKEKESVVEADMVLMAVGRRPNVSSVNLDDIGVEYTPKGIKVGSDMRTSVPHIFAIGDVTGGIMLAHAATFQGKVALDAILAEAGLPCEARHIDLSIIPAAVFTSPEAAMVGLTEEDCEAGGLAVRCLKSRYQSNGKAVSMGQTDGFCKMIISQEDGRILGCHIFGAHSADLVQELSALMAMGATLEDFRGMVHAHPTLSEVLQSIS